MRGVEGVGVGVGDGVLGGWLVGFCGAFPIHNPQPALPPLLTSMLPSLLLLFVKLRLSPHSDQIRNRRIQQFVQKCCVGHSALQDLSVKLLKTLPQLNPPIIHIPDQLPEIHSQIETLPENIWCRLDKRLDFCSVLNLENQGLVLRSEFWLNLRFFELRLAVLR